jgi:hypothetical protein
MSPDLLIKLIVIPVAAPVIIYTLVASEPNQSAQKIDVSAQYNAGRGVTGSTNGNSLYNADRSEAGLRANANQSSKRASRVSYFDYLPALDLGKGSLLSRLAEGKGHKLSIVGTSLDQGLDGYTDETIAGGTLAEDSREGGENTAGKDPGTKDGGYFSGLSGLDNFTDHGQVASLSCQPYAQIQATQSRSKSEQSNNSALGFRGEGLETSKKLVDSQNFNTLSPLNQTQSSELNVADLVDAVTIAKQPPNLKGAIAKTGALNDCFILQAKTVLDLKQLAIAPIKQMPNLAYHNYLYSATESPTNIGDESARFFLFRQTESSPEDIEKRQRLYQIARQSVSKWNAF